ncbi:hypothetical protein [Nonomuraea sp. NPDC049028]|uniref:hypothetical protein n=1 Tax=Nonomuraea sp. NPDC049028 TaxID=3364348 RepID=UPI003714D691
MTACEQCERFDRLARLAWELHSLGIRVSLGVPLTGRPVLEVVSESGAKVHITAIRRRCGWVFSWRPWWARLWRRDKWVVAHAANVADIIAAEVNA